MKGYGGDFRDSFRGDRFEEVWDGVGACRGRSGFLCEERFKKLVGVAGGVFIGVGVTFRVNEFGNFGFRGVIGVSKEVGCGAGVLGVVFGNFLEFVSEVKGFLDLVAFGC